MQRAANEHADLPSHGSAGTSRVVVGVAAAHLRIPAARHRFSLHSETKSSQCVFLSFSPHLRAIPHRWVCFCRLHHLGVTRGCLLLQMSPAQAGAPAEPRPWREPLDGDHPHDPQRQHFARVLLPPVQHGGQLQLQRQLRGPGAPNKVPDQLLLARGDHEQRVCQHAHKFLCAELSAGHPDCAPSRAVPAPPICGVHGAA